MKREHDEVGWWTEMKLEIVRDYAKEYSKIMSRQAGFKHIYIDGFAGAGIHLSRTRGEFIPGSPLNALNVEPPFREYHFIDLIGHRAEQIRELAGDRQGVFVYEGDCNAILPAKVFPRADYDKYERALCLLDPYNIDVAWEVVAQAGKMRSIEIFLNFMIMDINMNVLRHDPDRVDQAQIARMNRFWGDESWRDAIYDRSGNLFGWEEKVGGNEALADAYRKRLREVAGFRFVPAPVMMRNNIGRTVYYLFFASPNATGHKIIEHIFNKYRNKGAE
jgi:three-Cys-motif partner protein